MRISLQTALGTAACLVTCLSASANPDTVRMLQVLLRPAGWSAEWSGPGGSGLTEVVFEQRADRIVAKIRLVLPYEFTCENPVAVEANRVTFDGCRDPRVTLAYDPGDESVPFRGRSPRGYEWKVKPK